MKQMLIETSAEVQAELVSLSRKSSMYKKIGIKEGPGGGSSIYNTVSKSCIIKSDFATEVQNKDIMRGRPQIPDLLTSFFGMCL